MSNFPFISNNIILQRNLDMVFDHIIDLLVLSDSEAYKGRDKKILRSSFRKTVIIYTASIIEALLLWKLKLEVKENKIELRDYWKYVDIKTLFEINKFEEIIGSRRIKKVKDINRLRFFRIIDYCLKYNIISRELSEELHEIRDLRNRVHIGNLSELEKQYSQKDLNFVFSVTRKVKKIL